MIISKEIEIDACHRVCYHNSKCRNLHWHRYKIKVTVEWEVIDKKYESDYWMVIDYGDLKEIMMEYIDEPYDHWAIFYKEDPYKEKLLEMMELEDQNPDKLHFVDFMPTAENLCKFWYEIMETPLIERGIKIKSVEVHETPTSVAIYTK